MKYYLHCLILVVFIGIACKNTTNSNSSDEILNTLPNEIANKTWVLISEDTKESYQEILEYSNKKENNNIITYKDSIFFMVDEEILFLGNKVKSVKRIIKGYKIVMDNDLLTIDFSWVKDKKIAKWVIKIPDYKGKGKDFNMIRFTVDKKYVTPENFPITKKKEKVDISEESEKILNSNLYSEILEDLPLEGEFACDYKEEGDDYVFQGGKLSLSNQDKRIYSKGKNGEQKEIEKNVATITFVEYLTVQCDVRKIKNSQNKYVLFYKRFINTKFSVKESAYYSKMQPIAEIEIIDNNTIKKKWLGFYNKRTKQMENAEDFGWQDEYCDIIKRVE